MSLVKPAALFVCVALAGCAGKSDSGNASAKDGWRSFGGKETAARAEQGKSAEAAKKVEDKAELAPAKPVEKKPQTAAKAGQKPAPVASRVESKKAAPLAAKLEQKKAAQKPEPTAVTKVEPKAEPAAAQPADDNALKATQAEVKKTEVKKAGSSWWRFGGKDKAVDTQAQLQSKKSERQPVSKAWLDDNEKRLKAAVAGSKFEVERRGDLLVLVAPADTSFNRDRPHMLLPVTLGPLSRMAKLVAGDAQSAVLVLGHADGSGNAEQSRKLTLERAQAVGSIFRMSGLKNDRLMLRGMGGDKPRASNDNLKGREQNRRIEIILTQRDYLAALVAQNSR